MLHLDLRTNQQSLKTRSVVSTVVRWCKEIEHVFVFWIARRPMDLMQDNAHTLLRNRAVEEEKDEDKPIVQQDFGSQHQHRLLMFQNGQLMQLIQLMLWCGGEEDTHASSTVLQLKTSSSWRGWCIAKMHACILACRLTHHITRFAPLNVFGCKQLNFSWTSINLWKGVETLDINATAILWKSL